MPEKVLEVYWPHFVTLRGLTLPGWVAVALKCFHFAKTQHMFLNVEYLEWKKFHKLIFYSGNTHAQIHLDEINLSIFTFLCLIYEQLNSWKISVELKTTCLMNTERSRGLKWAGLSLPDPSFLWIFKGRCSKSCFILHLWWIWIKADCMLLRMHTETSAGRRAQSVRHPVWKVCMELCGRQTGLFNFYFYFFLNKTPGTDWKRSGPVPAEWKCGKIVIMFLHENVLWRVQTERIGGICGGYKIYEGIRFNLA